MLSVISVLISFFLWSQKPVNDGMAVGRIISASSKKPLEYIKIQLLTGSDSSVIFTQYTDVDGRFRFENLAYSTFWLSVYSNGYNALMIRDIQPTKDIRIVNLGSLELVAQNERTTDEITIQRKQEILYSGIDKKVYNVSQDLTLRGGTANDVLKNLPSIDLDQDGRILLRGEGSVNILIDGKPSSLAGSNGKTLLDALPAGSIERVEIVTNPSAKYDPDGSSGIINIVLKKNKLKGFNGLITANLGSGNLRGGNVADESASLSYRNANVNAFASYNGRYLTGYRNNFTYSRQIASNDSIVILDQSRLGTDLNAGHTARAGADWVLKKIEAFLSLLQRP